MHIEEKKIELLTAINNGFLLECGVVVVFEFVQCVLGGMCCRAVDRELTCTIEKRVKKRDGHLLSLRLTLYYIYITHTDELL